MTIDDLKELHFIAPIESVNSILQNGIISHNEVQKIIHRDISMPEIQDRRAFKIVPGGRPLHDYANLYFDAHNPMLSKRRDQNSDLCVLRIDKNILFNNDVIITDRNAASDYVRFYKSPGGLAYLDKSVVFATYWNHEDPIKKMEHKSIKCAEVLVPDRVSQKFILGAYVCDLKTRNRLLQTGFNLAIDVKTKMFF